jgi:Peptidase S24-like
MADLQRDPRWSREWPSAERLFPTRSVVFSRSETARLIRDALEVGGELWVNACGGSMHPTIRNGDRVLLGPPTRDIKRGEIVLASMGPRLILHRVIDIQKDVLITRGDARDRADPPISREDVIARALVAGRAETLECLRLTRRFGAMPLARFAWRAASRRLRPLKATVRAILPRREGAE